MSESKEKAASLVRKLANVMGAIERVPKTGLNKFHNYSYATESDITAAVRAAMSEQGVMMVPTLEKMEWAEVTTSKGGKERLCTASYLFTILDADSDAKIEFRNISQGQDAGDKAAYKAATGAVKYALLKLFLIPTGDDPEAASPEADHGPSQAEIAEKAEIEKVKAQREAARVKLLASLDAVGITSAAVANILGHSVDRISNDEWTKLQKLGADAKAAMGADPDEAARQAVAAQAEAALAESEAAHPSVPQTPEQTSKALTQSIFAALIDKIRAAETDKAVLLIGAEFPAMEKTLSKGDMAALRRAYADRLLILQDKSREAKKPKLQIKDEVH